MSVVDDQRSKMLWAFRNNMPFSRCCKSNFDLRGPLQIHSLFLMVFSLCRDTFNNLVVQNGMRDLDGQAVTVLVTSPTRSIRDVFPEISRLTRNYLISVRR